MISPAVRHYHFTGVAGVGMSAIAQVVLAQGNVVTGSDRDYDAGKVLDVIRKLKLAGVKFVPQDGSSIDSNTAGVVVSTAIENDNPDVTAARRLGVPVVHRAEMLAKLVDGMDCVAITGTSGKSTVTGMTGWILEQSGADPVVVNGAPVLNWCDSGKVGNMRYGGSKLWVIEADESDKSLLKYHPDWAVITNISRDHFDLPETVALFTTFATQVKKGVINIAEEPGLVDSFRPEVSAAGSSFVYKGTEFAVPLAGRHNSENALCAVITCERLGYSLEQIRVALASFKGIQRRLEMVGRKHGVAVIDDYAHNPAKIKAAWQAVAPVYKHVIGVWRPHGYRPLVSMMDDLVSMFAETCRSCDKLMVLPVYDAGGTADRSVNSDQLAERLNARNIPAEYVPDTVQAVKAVSGIAMAGDVVLVMGARDPGLSAFARDILEAIR